MPIFKEVSFTSPQAAEEPKIALRMALARQLQQQAEQPLEGQNVPGGWYVPPSPMQGFAKLAQAYSAAKLGKRATEDQSRLINEKVQRQGADVNLLVNALRGQPAQPAGLSEDASGNVTQMPEQPARTPVQSLQSAIPMMGPEVQQAALPMMTEQQKLAQEAKQHADIIASKEREMAANREDRAVQLDISRMDREAAQGRQQSFMREERAGREAFQASQSAEMRAQQERLAAENRAFREMMLKASREGRPLSEFQGKNVLFGARMAQSDKIMTDLEDKISTTGLAAKRGVQGLPIIGGMAGAVANKMLSPEQQKVEQAQRDFVNATLRQESGANINASEFDNAVKQYFPQPGDDPKTIAQKRQNRKLAINAFKVLAGSGGEQIDALLNTPQMPGNAPGGSQSASGHIVVDY